MKKLVLISVIASVAMILAIQLPLFVPAHAQESGSECWAVIAGVSDYQRLDDLDFADDGAQELYDLISPVWGQDNVKLLLNGESRKMDVMAALNWLADMDSTGDTVLFYFAGHGDSGYIAPYDAYYEETWISRSELARKLDKLDAEKVVVILDSCYSGRFEKSISDDGRVILMSSASNEYSYEVYFLENLTFTHYVLEAIDQYGAADTNQDGELSAEEVFRYAEPETISLSNEFEIEQHPVLSDGYAGEVSLLVKFFFDTNLNIKSGLVVDGEQCSGVSTSFIWQPDSTHEIQVSSQVDDGSDRRCVFLSWDDGISSPSRTVQGGTYTANYKRQYLLNINSAYGEPEGDGWYDDGSTATISMESIREPTVRHNFTGWSGDYNGSGGTASITMNSPKKVTANWKNEYLLTINSAYGQPKGAGWYDEGNTATISVESVEEPTVRHNFAGWTGDYKGSGGTASVTMNSPKKVTVNWENEYLLSINSAYGEPEGAGWYDEGNTATVTVPDTVGVIIRQFFDGWSGDITGKETTATVVVDSPKTIVAEWRTDYTQLIILIAGLAVIAGIITGIIVMRRR